MNAIPKLQHYVPRFYLFDGFAEKGKVQVFDYQRDKTFPSNPKGVASQSHFYTISGADPFFYENTFATLEGQAKQLFDSLYSRIDGLRFDKKTDIKKIQLSNNEMCVLLTYVAVQYMRTPARREVIMAFEKNFSSQLQKFKSYNEKVVFQDDVEECIRENLNRTEISNDEFCSYIRGMIAPTARMFLARDWNLFRYVGNHPKIITSDNPVSIINQSNYKETYLGDPNSTLSFPLNHRDVIWAPFDFEVAFRKQFYLTVRNIYEDDPQIDNMNVNAVTTFFARNYLFGNKDSVAECVRMINETKANRANALIERIADSIIR